MRAAKRTGPQNFMVCVRKTLEEHYGKKPVGVGGTFLLESGKAKIHVMVSIILRNTERVNRGSLKVGRKRFTLRRGGGGHKKFRT